MEIVESHNRRLGRSLFKHCRTGKATLRVYPTDNGYRLGAEFKKKDNNNETVYKAVLFKGKYNWFERQCDAIAWGEEHIGVKPKRPRKAPRQSRRKPVKIPA